jgi:hypothetical protein
MLKSSFHSNALDKSFLEEKYNKDEVSTRKSSKHFYIEVLGGSCQRCSYSEFQDSLEFYCVYPKENLYAGITVVKKDLGDVEIDTCCLLCSCCCKSIKQWGHTVKFIKKEYGWGLIRNDT